MLEFDLHKNETPTSFWKSEFFLDGSRSYEDLWRHQSELVSAIAQGRADETVIYCEHEPVITLGRRAKKENLLQTDEKFKVIEIERGGDATLHNPGQLVVYPLFRLGGENLGRDLHGYLRFLEEAIIQVLVEDFQLEAGRFGPTGVWVKTDQGLKKIASIGIAVRRWITYHGAAINVSNDLNDFKRIRPCDFESSVMTSLKALGHQCSLDFFAERLDQKMIKLV